MRSNNDFAWRSISEKANKKKKGGGDGGGDGGEDQDDLHQPLQQGEHTGLGLEKAESTGTGPSKLESEPLERLV